MGQEILALKGRLQQAKEKRRVLDAQAAVQIRAARDILDPFQKPYTKIRVDEAVVAVGSLNVILTEAKEVDMLIEQLEEAIG